MSGREVRRAASIWTARLSCCEAVHHAGVGTRRMLGREDPADIRIRVTRMNDERQRSAAGGLDMDREALLL